MRIFWPNCREVEEGEITEAQRNTIDHLRQEYDLTDNIQIEREFGSLRGALEDVILMRLVWFDGEMWISRIAGDGHVHTRNQGVVNLKGEGGRWRIDHQ